MCQGLGIILLKAKKRKKLGVVHALGENALFILFIGN